MSLALLGAEPTRGVLVRIRNAQQLAVSKGGAPGAIAATVIPETIESVVLDKTAEQFRQNLKANGVDADVQVVSAVAHKPATSGFRDGVLAGVVGTTTLVGLWKYGLSKLF